MSMLTYNHRLMAQPSWAIWGSVSSQRTLQTKGALNRTLDFPIWRMTYSSSWATAVVNITSLQWWTVFSLNNCLVFAMCMTAEWLCANRGNLCAIINIPGRPQISQLLLKWGWQKVFKFCTTVAQTNQLFTRVPINSSVLISRYLQQLKNKVCVHGPNVSRSTVIAQIHIYTHMWKGTNGLINLKLFYINTHCWGQRGYLDGNMLK